MAMYDLDEVHRHKTDDSLWVAHEGRVYDVTGFVVRHPGGSDVLRRHGGDDVTTLMRSAPHPHSLSAYQILNKYCIGELQQKDHCTSQKLQNGASKNGHIKGNSHVENCHAGNGHAGNGHLTKTGTSRGHEDTGGFTMLGWREDEIIDWNKPIFWQVGKLGKNYREWVHSPMDRHIRLFHSDFVEFFSMTPWWVIPLIWLPVAAVFLYYGVLELKLNHTTVGVLDWGYAWLGDGAPVTSVLVGTVFGAGILLWTILEYAVHRWLFHLDPPADSPFLITTHFILHGQHHKAPFDKDRLVFPPVAAAGFAIFFWCIYSLIFIKPISQILISGTFIGYIFYDLTHYYLHHGGTPYMNYFTRLKTYHVKHHFLNQNKGFGISSKLWDYPFNTLIPDSPTHNNNKAS